MDQNNQSEPRGVSEKCLIILVHILLAARQCLLLTGQIVKAQTVNGGREQTVTTEPKNAPPLPMSKRKNKKSDEGKQCRKKEVDGARQKARINIQVSFQRWRSYGICKDSRATQVGCFSAEQVRTPA